MGFHCPTNIDLVALFCEIHVSAEGEFIFTVLVAKEDSVETEVLAGPVLAREFARLVGHGAIFKFVLLSNDSKPAFDGLVAVLRRRDVPFHEHWE